jgi:hypothetical protein
MSTFEMRKAVKLMKKKEIKPDAQGNYIFPLDYRTTEIGRQNWEVCTRMLVHDLIDLAASTPELKALLEFYHIGFTPDGGYTMALPRRELLKRRGLKVKRG